MNSKNFYESLNEMVTDARFRNLALTQNFEHFFGRQGMNETETMSFLGWALNPRGAHGFSDVFMREMLTTCWSMIHGQQGEAYRTQRQGRFYAELSPVAIEQRAWTNVFVDRDAHRECPGADIVITDVDARLMVVINNRFEEKACERIVSHYTQPRYEHFERRVFLSCDRAVEATRGSQWCYMSNNWMIQLTASLLSTPRIAQGQAACYLQDFYQFLTGTRYGVSERSIGSEAAGLVSDYYATLVDLKNFRAEKIADARLIDINPREYVAQYKGQLSEREYGVLSLYWAYRSTFATFFQVVELETATRNMEKTVEGKGYTYERSFIRGGLSFTPAFGHVRAERSFINRIFDVELVQDAAQHLTLSLVANKEEWDRLSYVQRETLQKKFGFETNLVSGRGIVWNRYYGAAWQGKDLCSDIVEVFNKINDGLANIGIKVA